MGYTHYYKQRRSMTLEEFDGFSEDVEKLVAAFGEITTVAEFDRRFGRLGSLDWEADAPLAVKAEATPNGRIVDDGVVGFNGCGPDGSDDDDWGHETFLVERQGSGFQFTKTARKPYDALVCACLLALTDRAASAWEVSSDGSPPSWAPGYLLAKHALGRDLPLERVGAEPDKDGALIKEIKEFESAWMLAQRQRRELEAKVDPVAKLAGQARSI